MKDRNGKTLRKGDVCVVSQERLNTSHDWNNDLIGGIAEIVDVGKKNYYTFPVLVWYGGHTTIGLIGFIGDELEIIGDVR